MQIEVRYLTTDLVRNALYIYYRYFEGSITLGSVCDGFAENIGYCRFYAQHMGIQMTDIVISKVTLKKLYGLLSKAESQNFIRIQMKFWRNLGLMRL